MARSSAQCDSVAYMDGVHVKIAEAYKPPRKMGLPTVYNNKLPDVSKPIFDFSLEKSVLEKMSEWRKVRRTNHEIRQVRLEEKKKKEEERYKCSQTLSSTATNNISLNIVPTADTSILTPQPLSPQANEIREKVKENGLNYADFDNDTSSPFDNMELKTINDMEELAQLLQSTPQWTPEAKSEQTTNNLKTENESSICNKENDELPDQTNNNENIDKCSISYQSVSEIVQGLQKELENWKPWPDLESPEANVSNFQQHSDLRVQSNSKLTNPLSDLLEEDKQLAQQLADMGFPIARAARGVRDLGGDDNKKVIEYLLAVQSLEENGIPGDDAEKALVLTEYNQDKAKAYCKNLYTLKDLGFSEDQASLALLKCNIDRDKALDFLIS
ncbi:ubiquitin-associated protein 1 [Prorops nasuta]|uniref:ubiquitin-associated protein 1 n=1 Tax=Prorops nasuta TaxID=863751 RepID=UPI0034CF3510